LKEKDEKEEGRMSISRIIAFVLVIGLSAGVSWGYPALQIYVEGANYDFDTETWVVTDPDAPVRLWVIGNTAGSGNHGDISNVRLAVAYIPADGPVSINITPSTTEGYNSVTDPSTPSTPTYIQTVTDGSVPLLSDGSDLPTHGVYTLEGVEWQEYLLGDMTLNDSPVGDFVGSFPSALQEDAAQINVYEIDVSGADWFHFDVYDSTESPTRAVFAPFSRDAGTGDVPPVPEPGTVALVGLGIMTMVGSLRRGFR
jgi:hypothetical protein